MDERGRQDIGEGEREEDLRFYEAFMERLCDLCPALRERLGPSIGPIKGVE